MIFNSYFFVLFFLPISLIFFYGAKLASPNVAKITIFLLSIFFYGFWDVGNIPLLIFSVLFNYFLGVLIGLEYSYRKIFLFVGIIVNLSVLIYYKYVGFLSSIFGVEVLYSKIILPLAISFFTFEQISYLVDKYKGYIKENDFLTYVFFITFFPRLIAGPIYYYREYKDKINHASADPIDWGKFSIAITLFSLALFKKVIVADRLAQYSNKLYSSALETVSVADSWVGSLAYTLQIYFDFSAYSEMALAVGLMFGIELPINFNSPYKATSIIDFWNRWHISLSRFIKDYIYIPLGGSRLGIFRQHLNLIITMTIAGIWHGAGWTFFMWGILYGFLLSVNHFLKRIQLSFPVLGSWFVTFFCIHLLWIPFRANSFSQALGIWAKVISIPKNFDTTYTPRQIMFCCSVFFISLIFPNLIQVVVERNNKLRWKNNLFWSILTAIFFVSSILEMNHVSPFLYFNF